MKWIELLVNLGFVRGYRVRYKYVDRFLVCVIIVLVNENVVFINIWFYLGCLYEVWIFVIGEIVDSEEINYIYFYLGNLIC